MRAAAWLLVAMTACSFTFDGEEPDVPLRGAPPPPGTYAPLNRAPASGVAVLRDPAGALWAAINETPTRAGPGPLSPPPSGPPPQQVQRLVALQPPAAEEVVKALGVGLSGRMVYLINPGKEAVSDKEPAVLQIRPPCAGCAGRSFTLAPGNSIIIASAGDEAFLAFKIAQETTRFTVHRADGSFARELPAPPGVDPTRPLEKGRLSFDEAGELLFAQGADLVVTAHSTRREQDQRLGKLPRSFAVDGSTLLACDEQGLRRVPGDGAAVVVLDAAPCDDALWGFAGDSLFYRARPAQGREELRAVSLVRGGAPRLRLSDAAAQVLAVDGDAVDGDVVYSKDPPTLFGGGIGDGWLRGRRFMERGRAVSFGRDGQRPRLRWLERAATSENVGELLSAPRDGSAPPLRLALNVRQYGEIGAGRPGRVLAISNAAYRGAQNRLIVIDEEAREARWLLAGARDYQRVPGTDDLLVRVVTGPAFDILRVPLPRE